MEAVSVVGVKGPAVCVLSTFLVTVYRRQIGARMVSKVFRELH